MPQMQCPHCGQTYDLTDQQAPQYAGQTITCTKCQKPFPVPATVAPQASAAGPPAYPIAYASAQPYAQKRNGFAVASLVSACIGLIVPLIPGILAIIFGIVGLRRTRDPNVSGKGLAVAGICVGAFSILLGGYTLSILLPSLNLARETANRIKCASNMRQIGQAVLLYSNENRNAYPDRLEQLLATQDITADVFVCPSSNETPAPGNTPQEQAQKLSNPAHLSYVYVGKGMTSSISSEAWVLYEPLADHDNDGINVLFGDGRVEFISRPQAAVLIDSLKAGHNPPMLKGPPKLPPPGGVGSQ